ncbi:MAG: haloacid dehalogenase type II [Syntrophobacteraceae bacterium]|jgi:2-haloacid dehalogenase|nr:haloacid dehalogenase type II [Syntrophobacteraceae bacterium]
MTGERLHGIKGCVFDAYGTLFDFNSAVARCRDVLGEQADTLSRIWREKQLQYTWLRSLMGRHEDFWKVTGDALDFAMRSLEIRDEALRERLMSLYRVLDAFPEVPATLEALKSGGFKTAILSNGSPEMLLSVVQGTGIAHLLDAVLSVEAVGIYKPHPSVYKIAVDSLSLDAEAICFVSANAWDAHGASAFGLKVVWCNRYGQSREILPGAADVEVSTLAEIPSIVGIRD